MVVFEVDRMIVRPMWGHELGLFVGEYIKEIVVLRRDNLSNKLPLVHWKWLCEGDTETRPLIYRDSLRQGEPNRCDTLTQW